MQTTVSTSGIAELDANRGIVSVDKCGFFLCHTGTARILMGKQVYQVERNCLCIYTPNTLFQILERSDDLRGILVEDTVDACYPVISTVDVRHRLRIRTSPCVMLSDSQAASITTLADMTHEGAPDGEQTSETAAQIRAQGRLHLLFALCLKVLEVYFLNAPVEAQPPSRDDVILNRFLVSVYEHCHSQRTVRYYADSQHLSPYYFSSIIKACSGRSALQWIESVTMTFAHRYLECSEMSIKEIAERLSFPDQSTFCRWFKHHEGCTPSSFRHCRNM